MTIHDYETRVKWELTANWSLAFGKRHRKRHIIIQIPQSTCWGSEAGTLSTFNEMVLGQFGVKAVTYWLESFEACWNTGRGRWMLEAGCYNCKNLICQMTWCVANISMKCTDGIKILEKVFWSQTFYNSPWQDSLSNKRVFGAGKVIRITENLWMSKTIQARKLLGWW